MPSQSGVSYRAYNYPGNPGSAAWDTITLAGPVAYPAELYGMQLHQNKIPTYYSRGQPGSWVPGAVMPFAGIKMPGHLGPYSGSYACRGHMPLLLAAAVGIGLAYIILKK